MKAQVMSSDVYTRLQEYISVVLVNYNYNYN